MAPLGDEPKRVDLAFDPVAPRAPIAHRETPIPRDRVLYDGSIACSGLPRHPWDR